MAPLEPWKKVLVDKEYLLTDHGALPCVQCHGGNPGAATREAAHKGVRRDPTYPDPTACAECHPEIVKLNKTSLHISLEPFRTMAYARASADKKLLDKVDEGLKNHCSACHASCGECHVSRPKFAEGGFVAGHRFFKRPNMIDQCTACHGSRVGNEYLGSTGLGDVHYTRKSMDCMACHNAGDLHGDGKSGHLDRYQVDNLSTCRGCHKPNDAIEQHKIHGEKLQCQVCHSQPYANCVACHVGKDAKGLAFYKNPNEAEGIKIGLNTRIDAKRPAKWVLVRRVPVVPDIFDFYAKDALPRFDDLPTWKYTSPHNIQRKTTQNRECNNCHGNASLFLSEADVGEWLKANKKTVVPVPMIPARVDLEGGKDRPKKKSLF